MTIFIDGPASGQVLKLQRAPVFLRVVEDTWTGKFDALDQLYDNPQPDEKIHVYIITGQAGMVHVDRRNPETGKKEGLWFVSASYRYVGDVAADDEVRLFQKWQDWTEQNRGLVDVLSTINKP